MTPDLPSLRVQPPAAPGHGLPRRSFLRYTGASVALGSLWIAGCNRKEEPAPPAPTITGFSPGSAMPGATITLTGTNFAGTTAVLLGNVAAAFTVVNATTITLTVPTAAQTGAFVVTTPGGTATSPTGFTVVATPLAPTIAGFTPTSALPGTIVTVTGTNFTGATAVTVSGLAAPPTVLSATSLTFVVPATPTPTTAVTGALVVTNPAGTGTAATTFTILPAAISVGTGDAGVLNYAYGLEQLEAAFYTLVRLGSYYLGLAAGSAEKLALDDLYHHEVIHSELLKAGLTAAGAPLLPALTPDFASIDFSSRSSVLGAARTLEDLGVAAYNGVARFIVSPAYLALAGKIVSVEARHAALIRDLVREGDFVGPDVVNLTGTTANGGLSPLSAELSKLPSVVAAIANNFLAVGSKLDVASLG